MNKTNCSKLPLRFLLCTTLAAALTGCVGYVGGRGGVYAESPSGYVETGVVAQPDYVYYPDYQVYYSGHNRQYTYQEGRSWVSRSAPPRVSANVLFASPSVKLDFHDHPSNHHAAISKQYPQHGAPASQRERN